MIRIGDLLVEPWFLWFSVVVALVLLALLAVLSWLIWDIIRPRMKEGKVIKKRFIPAHDELETTYMFTGVVPFSHRVYHEKEWTITIEGKFRGKIRRETYSVSRSQYIRIKRGSYVKFVK